MRIILFASALLLCACTSGVLEPAVKVGAAGASASDALIAQSRTTSDVYRGHVVTTQARAFLVSGGANTAPQEEKLDADILSALAAREQLFVKLKSAYGAFEQLAASDAKGDTIKAFDDLKSAYLGLAPVAVAMGYALPVAGLDVAVDAVKQGFGLLAQENQARKVLAANEVMLKVLPGVQGFVASEKGLTLSILRVGQVARARLRTAMVQAKLADVTPSLVRLADAAGVEVVKDAAKAMSPKIRDGVLGFAAWQDVRAVADLEVQYDKLGAQLGKMIAAHEQLKEKAKPDVAAVIARSQDLLAAVRAFRQAYFAE